jgi:hypothetical protein
VLRAPSALQQSHNRVITIPFEILLVYAQTISGSNRGTLRVLRAPSALRQTPLNSGIKVQGPLILGSNDTSLIRDPNYCRECGEFSTRVQKKIKKDFKIPISFVAGKLALLTVHGTTLEILESGSKASFAAVWTSPYRESISLPHLRGI